MHLSKLLAAVVASSLIAAPAFARQAAANQAAPLSISKAMNAKVMTARASTSARKSNKLDGGATIVVILATAAVIGGVLSLTDKDSDSD